eukprot:364443-Chlamydomonas_euryale.AAC.17
MIMYAHVLHDHVCKCALKRARAAATSPPNSRHCACVLVSDVRHRRRECDGDLRLHAPRGSPRADRICRKGRRNAVACHTARLFDIPAGRPAPRGCPPRGGPAAKSCLRVPGVAAVAAAARLPAHLRPARRAELFRRLGAHCGALSKEGIQASAETVPGERSTAEDPSSRNERSSRRHSLRSPLWAWSTASRAKPLEATSVPARPTRASGTRGVGLHLLRLASVDLRGRPPGKRSRSYERSASALI